MTNRPHFFKIFFPDLIGKPLKIPPAFAKHLTGEVRGSAVVLIGPSGEIWNVGLLKDSRGMSLTNGWEEFVADNSISPNDFLLFRYEGNLRFTVMIFNMTACEREASFFATPSKEQDLAFLTIADGPGRMSIVKEEEGYLPPQSFVSPKVSGGISKEWYAGRDQRERIFKRTPTNQSYQRRRSPYIKQVNIKARIANFISKRCPVTNEDVRKAYEAAKSFNSDYPTALVVMESSYVYHGFYLNLPVSFVNDHMPKETQHVKLWNVDKRLWIVNYVYYEGRGGFSANWGAFSVANNLESNDVCVFELINETEMQVHIFRVVDGITTPQELQENCSSLVRHNATRQAIDISRSLKSIYEQQLQAETTEILPTSSKKLSFSVTLRQYNVGNRKATYLRIPKAFGELDFLHDKSHAILVNDTGKSWKVNIYQHHIRDRISIRFTDGWEALCLDNKLELGDICIFELISKEINLEFRMVIHKKQQTTS